jgi:hypothetical protein
VAGLKNNRPERKRREDRGIFEEKVREVALVRIRQKSGFQTAIRRIRCCADRMTWHLNIIFGAILHEEVAQNLGGLAWIWPFLTKAIEIGSQLVTLVLGLIALCALIFHGRRVTHLLNALSYQFVSARAQKVRDILSKLNDRNYDDKESRREIFALLGELSGRLKPFVSMAASLEKCYQDLEVLTTFSKNRLSK